MTQTLTYAGTLTVETCWCGIRHAIPSELARQATENGHRVYCPLGHVWVVRTTELDKTRRALEQAQSREKATRQLLEHEERSHAATRGHLTRQKKRATAGVCPCCNRTFQQLARHMKTKHPEFVADPNGAANSQPRKDDE